MKHVAFGHRVDGLGGVASPAEAWIETGDGLGIWPPVGRVASPAEAWIETAHVRCCRARARVASPAEAWIETGIPRPAVRGRSWSPPLRRRGLKLSRAAIKVRHSSPPLRRRGLKHRPADHRRDVRGSPPLRRRGLKHGSRLCLRLGTGVASPAEAWIETLSCYGWT